MTGLAILAISSFVAGMPMLASTLVTFEPNRGQSATEIEFIGRAGNTQAFFSRKGFAIRAGFGEARFQFAASSAQSWWEPDGETVGRIHYQRPHRAVRDVPQTNRLRRRELYPGVDVVFYGRASSLEFDLLLRPGADVRRIQLDIDLADQVELDASGALRVSSEGRLFIQQVPYAYQTDATGQRQQVNCRYRLMRSAPGAYRLTFELGSYDATRPLVIDPVITNASLIGGSDADEVIAVGPNWTVGNTRSIDGPVRQEGPIDLDVFVSSRQAFTTFVIGGSGIDRAWAAADERGWLAIVGETNSRDLFARNIAGQPVGRSAQPVFGGGEADGFVLLMQSASSIFPSFGTYIGGTGVDRLTCVTIDPGTNPPRVIAAGTTTSQDLPVSHAAQVKFGGGNRDAFWATYGTNGTLVNASYFGGPGDDTILAVQADVASLWLGGSTTNSLWLGGENTAGEQAFLGRAERLALGIPLGFGAPLGRVLPYASRVTALRSWQQEVYAAGVTSSTELPTTSESSQQTYGGGPSDAFVGRWSADLSALRWITYLGGQGADEALALDVNDERAAAAGWTDSTDLPLSNPQQPVPGGQQDGWAAVWQSSGTPAWSTYLGGAGHDRIQTIRLEGQLEVRLGGVTSSPDFLAQALPAGSNLLFDQRDLRGASDGFIVSVGTELFAPDVVGTTDATVDATPVPRFLPRDTEGVAELADGSVAEWVVGGTAAGSSARFATGSSGTIAIRCLAETGETELRYRIDGRLAVARLWCRPAELDINLPDSISSFRTELALSPILGPRNPRTGKLVGISRVVPNEEATFASLSPEVVEVTASGFSAFGSSGFARLAIKRLGEATFQFTVRGREPVRKTVTIRPPQLTLSGPPLGKDLQARYRLAFEENTPPGLMHQLTLRSSDSGRLLIPAFNLQFGPGQRLFEFDAQALAGEGTVHLDAESSVAGKLQFPISLFPTGVRWTAFGQPSPLPVELGGSSTVQVSLVPGDPNYVPGTNDQIRLRSGLRSLEIPVVSSAPAIAEPGENRLVFTGEVSTRTLAIHGRAAGSATLTFAPPAGAVVLPGGALPLRVAPRAALIGSTTRFIIGAHLQESLFVSSPNGPTTLTSLDPGRLLLSLSADQPGQASVRLASSSPVYAQALAGEGEVKVRATGPNSETSETVFRLHPSAIIFPETLRAPALVAFELAARSWVLDPVTRVPLFAQPLSPSAAPLVDFELDRQDLLRASPRQLSLPGTFRSENVHRATQSAVSTGDLSVTLVQPPGFSVPAYGNRMRIRIEPFGLPAAQSGTPWTPEGFQQRWVYTPFSLPPSVPLTFTSSNPSLLRVSAVSNELGGASAVIRSSDAGYPVYLQSSRGTGRVDVTISGEHVEPRRVSVEVLAVAAEFQTIPGTIRVSPSGAEQTVPAFLRLLFRPGSENSFWASPTQPPVPTPGTASVVRVVSSRPEVVSATPEELNLAWNMSANVRLRGLSAGTAEVSLVSDPPRPSPTGADRVRVESGRAGVVPLSLTLGFGMIGTWNMELDTREPFPAGARVSIESRHPSRLLLSADASRPVVNRLEINAVQGQRGVNLLLHALGDSGTVVLDVAIDGAPAGTGQVTLVPTQIRFFGQSVQWVSTSQGQKLSLTTAFDQPPSQSISTALRVVPGATVRVVSANPAIVRIVNSEPLPIGPLGLPQIELVPVATGRTTVTLETTGGFIAGPPLAVEILPPSNDSLSVSLPPSLGRNLQAAVPLFASVGGPTTFTLTSNDPSRVVVSASPDTPGGPSASLTVTPSQTFDQRPVFWIQALGEGTGPVTVPLVLTGPGFPSKSYQVQLANPSLRLLRTDGGLLGTLSAPATISVRLGIPLDSNSWLDQVPRPGVTYPVTFSNADPSVGVVTPAQLTLSQASLAPVLPGSTPTLEWRARFEPRGPGTTIITAPAPPGFQTQISSRQLPITVLTSRLRVEAGSNPVRVGLGISARFSVNHSFGPLAAPLRITLVSSSPGRLLLSSFSSSGSPTTPAESIELTLSGNSGSMFQVTGAGEPGPAAIRLTAPGIPETVLDLDVLRTGFSLAEPNALTIAAGSFSSVQVELRALDPDTGQLLRLSANSSVRLPVTVSDSTVLRVPPELVLNTTASLPMEALRTGTATVSIVQPSGYQILPGTLQSVQITVR